MREYIVSLKKDVDYQQFWDQIENESQEDGFVPSRRVDIVNNRDGSLRSCHYSLTAEEAQILKNDPRVYSVEIPPQQRDDIKIGLTTTQTGDFTKTTSSSGSHINWGLIRNSNTTNVYGTGTTTNLTYDYLADGTGVDVVIHDSGLQIDHPEFQDASGNSRVQQLNWYIASGLSGTQASNHYVDTNGHGTHVAGIATGKTYGWAKNSKVFSVKVDGLDGGEGGGISITDCFDVVKLWHRNKPIDPTIGRKRPTIVNMSWGYSSGYGGVVGGNYRGTPWTGFAPDASKGMIASRNCPVRVGAIDVDLEELIDEGVIVCIAAGNDTHKIDVAGGIDYDNYWTHSLYGNIYYHRGSSPYSEKALMVGSMDLTPYNSSTDQKSWFSNAGPGIDIFAAGHNIQSSTSQVSGGIGSSEPYFLNSSYRQINISGTSMATPQMTGIGALFLQNNLTATPAQYKNWLKANGTSTIYSTGLDNDYSNQHSQYGGNTKVAYSFTGAGSNAMTGIKIFDGIGGKSTATFKRLPPRQQPDFGSFYGFENGTVGWNLIPHRVRLNGNSIIAGWPTPTDPDPRPGSSPGDTSYGFTGSYAITLETVDKPPTGEKQCLRLTMGGGVIDTPGNILYGPAVHSDFSVQMNAGDILRFNWKALAGGDAYNIFSYLVEVNTGATIPLLRLTGPNNNTGTGWNLITRSIQTGQDGDYVFVFIAGSYDSTFGQYIGGELLLDNITLEKAV
jgi:subtilisin family serine protease